MKFFITFIILLFGSIHKLIFATSNVENVRNLFDPQLSQLDFNNNYFQPYSNFDFINNHQETTESDVSISNDEIFSVEPSDEDLTEPSKDFSQLEETNEFKRHITFSPKFSTRTVPTKNKFASAGSPSFRVASDKNNSIQVTDIKCFISANEGMYGATLNGDFQSTQPVIEDGGFSDECKISCLNDNICRIEFESKDISKCGVHRCGLETEVMLCLTLRLPTVPKLILPEDVTIVLQCHPQATLISQKKQIRITPKEITGRMANTGTRIVATGGSKAHFTTQVVLFRHGSSGFTRKVSSGDFIVLGEELLLQSSVNPGDGWKYAKLTDVAVHRVINNEGEKSLVDTVMLVDSSGCRNPKMKNISPWHPAVDPQNDLSVSFLFRAFMFNGMKEGDELVISVQLLACVLKHHCFLKKDICDQSELIGKLRKKRTIIENVTTGWSEDLTFKIIFSNHDYKEHLTEQAIERGQNPLILTLIVTTGIFVMFLAVLVFFIFNYLVYAK